MLCIDLFDYSAHVGCFNLQIKNLYLYSCRLIILHIFACWYEHFLVCMRHLTIQFSLPWPICHQCSVLSVINLQNISQRK